MKKSIQNGSVTSKTRLDIPDHLLDAIRRKECILYAGAGFSLEARSPDGHKPPTGRALGLRLAQELYKEGYFPSEPKEAQPFDLAALAEDYETAFGRKKLIELLDDIFGAEGLEPGNAHYLAVKFFPTIITTNYDLLFEQAATRVGPQSIVIRRDKKIPFSSRTGRPIIIKLHGDLEDPERMIITNEDYRREPIPDGLREKLKGLLSEKTILFIGYSLADSDFQEIYFEVLDRLGKFKPRAFVVTPSPPESSPYRRQWELFRKRWEQKEMHFLDGTAGAFLEVVNKELALKPTVKEVRTSKLSDDTKLLNDYGAQLARHVSTVRLFGESEPRPLEKVFVQLNLMEEYRPPSDQAQRLGLMDAELRRRRDIFYSEREETEIQPGDKGEGKVNRIIKPDELMRARAHALIVGAPGCGKTTLLRYLAWKTWKEDHAFPVFLELKSITKSAFDEADGRLDKLLFNTAVAGWLESHSQEHQHLQELFFKRLDKGEVFIFLDGLDEMHSTQFFADLCRLLEEFLHSAYRNNPIIISTRPYALTTRLEGFRTLEIAPLSLPQVKEFLNHYYGNDPIVNQLLPRLQRRALRDLASVPFLLGVIVHLYHQQGDVIGERLELYRQIVQQLVIQLDREKRVERFHVLDPDGELKRDFLKQLAYERLFVDEVDKDAERLVFTGDVILEKARRFCRPELNPYWFAADVKATPLLREIASDAYAFAHLTLQEYLAAKALSEQEDCEKIFCRAYFNPTLAEMEVLPMTLGLVRKPDDLYTALEQLPESLTLTNLRLRARGLAYTRKIGRHHLTKLTDRLIEIIAQHKNIEESPYSYVVLRSLSGANSQSLSLILDRLDDLLHPGNGFASIHAASALGKIEDNRAVEMLLAALRGTNKYLSVYAALALGEHREERAVEGLVAALKDENKDVRWGAISALGELREERAVEELLAVLQKDEDLDVRKSAAKALGKIGGEQAMKGLIALSEESPELAIDGLKEMEDGTLEEVLAALEGKDSPVRERVAKALREIKNSRMLEEQLFAVYKKTESNRSEGELLKDLKDEDIVKRVRAAEALGKIGSERAVQGLLIALKDADHNVRERAAEALVGIGSEQVVAPLLAALKDEYITRRQQAAEWLGKIDNKALSHGLLRSLSHEDHFARQKAAQVIGYYADGQQVLEALLRLANTDPVDHVKNAASEALYKFYRKLWYMDEDVSALSAVEGIGRAKALEETRAFIAHEVKSAIGPLRMIAELLDDTLNKPDRNNDKLQEYTRLILKQTGVAYEVVNRYTDYTKPLTPTLRSTNIIQLLTECLDEVRAECARHNIEISQSPGQISKNVLIDRTLIAEAVRNILRNAIEAMESGGKLVVETRQTEDRLVITIRDTGPGIKPEYLSRVFELGFTTKLGRQGAGIGLALVSRIVNEAHGGRVSIMNNPGGMSTAVTIELPIAEKEK